MRVRLRVLHPVLEFIRPETLSRLQAGLAVNNFLLETSSVGGGG